MCRLNPFTVASSFARLSKCFCVLCFELCGNGWKEYSNIHDFCNYAVLSSLYDPAA